MSLICLRGSKRDMKRFPVPEDPYLLQISIGSRLLFESCYYPEFAPREVFLAASRAVAMAQETYRVEVLANELRVH